MTSTSEKTNARGKAAGNNRRLIILAVGGALVGLLVGWITVQFVTGNWRIGPYEYRGIALPEARRVNDFTLTTHQGEKARLSDFQGQVTVLYFGYTYCPDVCPTTLSELSAAMDELEPADKEQVQVLMVSVDPERDNLAALADYLAYFDSTFLGMTGTAEEISQAAEAFGIYYQKGEGSISSGYLVDHTATVSVLDKEGRLRLLFPFETPAEDIASDLEHLIRES